MKGGSTTKEREMSNGDMLKTIKNLIDDGDPFTAKQFQTMSLTGMVELGDNIKNLSDEINKVDTAAQNRVCPAVLQTQKDIEKLEGKSNRNDVIVGVGTVLGTIGGFLFGTK